MKEKFNELQSKWSSLSSLIVFSRLIRLTPKENWTARKITKWFNQLVDKSDYLVEEKKLLLKWLVQNNVIK